MHVPAHPELCAAVRTNIRQFQVDERYGFVWVCLGTPARDIPRIPHWDNAEFRKSFAGPVEHYAYERMLGAIRRCDVAIFMIDATEPVSQVDQKLSQELQEQFKPTVLAITTAGEGRFLEVNDAFLRLHGYTRDEVIGRTSAVIGTLATLLVLGLSLARLSPTARERTRYPMSVHRSLATGGGQQAEPAPGDHRGGARDLARTGAAPGRGRLTPGRQAASNCRAASLA